MKLARVFVQEYPGRQVGDIHDVIDPDNHPGSILSGTIKEVEVADDFDKDIMTAVIDGDDVTFEEDQDKVAAKAQADKVAQIQVKYDEMNTDVLTEMATVFGTPKPESATAYYETWKLMVQKPELFSGEGLVADKAAGGYDVGDALDSDLKVTTWAQARIDEAEAYGVSRAKRIKQFADEKAAIVAG